MSSPRRFEFGELGFVAGVGNAAGAEAVTKGEADVVFLENLDDVVEALVEEILFVVVGHPLGEDGAAAADDAGDALGDQRQILDQHAGVDGHVVDALGGLLFDDFEHDFGIQVFDAFDAGDGFVDRDRADGDGRVAENGFANFVDVAAGGKIHHRVGAVVDGGVKLLKLLVDFRRYGGVADVGVDLAERRDTDRHGFELRMVDVGGDDHASAGDFVAHQFGRQPFFVGDVGHFFGDAALAGVVHLREIAGGVQLLAASEPLCAGLGDVVAVAAVAICGSHDRARLFGIRCVSIITVARGGKGGGELDPSL